MNYIGVILELCLAMSSYVSVISVMLLSHFTSSGAIESHILFLSYSVITLALHITVILIITVP